MLEIIGKKTKVKPTKNKKKYKKHPTPTTNNSIKHIYYKS